MDREMIVFTDDDLECELAVEDGEECGGSRAQGNTRSGSSRRGHLSGDTGMQESFHYYGIMKRENRRQFQY